MSKGMWRASTGDFFLVEVLIDLITVFDLPTTPLIARLILTTLNLMRTCDPIIHQFFSFIDIDS